MVGCTFRNCRILRLTTSAPSTPVAQVSPLIKPHLRSISVGGRSQQTSAIQCQSVQQFRGASSGPRRSIWGGGLSPQPRGLEHVVRSLVWALRQASFWLLLRLLSPQVDFFSPSSHFHTFLFSKQTFEVGFSYIVTDSYMCIPGIFGFPILPLLENVPAMTPGATPWQYRKEPRHLNPPIFLPYL